MRAGDLLARLPALANGREEALVGQVRRLHIDLGLEDWADLELRQAIQETKRASKLAENGRAQDDQVAKVFAIVNEGIRRRLGAWRAFNDSHDALIPNYSHEDFRARHRQEGPPPEEELIRAAIERVHRAGAGRFGSDLLFSADVYRSLLRLDAAGRYRFHPTDQQLLAGLHLLSGRIVEMQAGEGKTIAIAFAAVMHAVLGQRVHVHTANDYLADRDCRLLAPLYRSLGLTADVILEPMDRTERRSAYGCDIVYGTVREFGFDYLRDNMVLARREQVQPALQVAIVDEADQAVIDEGDTPLIIAGPPSKLPQPWRRVNDAVKDLVEKQQALCQEYAATIASLPPENPEHGRLLCLALLAAPFDETLRWTARECPRSYRRGLAAFFPDGGDVPDESLTADLYYQVDEKGRFVTPTEKGLAFLNTRLGDFCPTAHQEGYAQDTDQNVSRKMARQLQLANQVYQSLRAHLLLEKNRDYLVSDDAVVILDKHTGRTKPDNLYRYGLQAALEAREELTVHPDCESLAQISVQGLANQYRFLSGITGTAQAASEEFQRRYFVKVFSVPQVQESRRVELPSRIYGSEGEKIAAVVDEALHCRRFGRPVLVGVQSIDFSQRISQELDRAGIEHRVLNAVTSEDEAEVVRSAGRIGAVTVATNMAGRGTDIVLDPELDQVLLDRWVQWILGETQTSVRPLKVVCHSRDEAQLLAAALERQPELSVGLEQWGDRFLFSVIGAGQCLNSNRTIEEGSAWEFGLGLHVISAEFSRFPRVATQLKGRSGRQGLFGSTRQLLSWEDRWLLPLAHRRPNFRHCRHQDGGGSGFHAGRSVERYIARRQDEAEYESANARSVTSDYAAVCDTHAATYYHLRRELLNGYDSDCRLRAIVRGCAVSLVSFRFPNFDTEDYGARFRGLVEDASGLYGIDVSCMAGEPLDRLPDLIEERLLARVEGIKSHLGNEPLQSLARSLWLECGDQYWRDHLADLQQAVFTSAAGGYYHKASVADYIIHARDMWEQFVARLQDAFLSRLLTFPLDLLADAPSGTPDGEDDRQELL